MLHWNDTIMARWRNLSTVVIALLLSAWQYTDGVQGEIFVQELYLLHPEVPTKPETYLTETFKVPTDKTYYIIGFQPAITAAVAHHMHLKGCPKVGEFWRRLMCEGMSSHIYNWDHSTNPYYFPEGMGVRIGVDGFTAVEMEIHYQAEPNLTELKHWNREVNCRLPESYTTLPVVGKVTCDPPLSNTSQCYRSHDAIFLPPWSTSTANQELHDLPSRSMVYISAGVNMNEIGVKIFYTDVPQPKAVANFLLVTEGQIHPQTTENFEVQCSVTEDVKMHIFAYRVHSHKLGKMVSGYVVRPGTDGIMNWTLIGEKSPQELQTYYTTQEELLVEKGDILAARCNMFNFRHHVVTMGKSSAFEMCNFYFMYWIDAAHDSFPSYVLCGSEGPPNYYWNTDHNLNNVPQ